GSYFLRHIKPPIFKRTQEIDCRSRTAWAQFIACEGLGGSYVANKLITHALFLGELKYWKVILKVNLII
ncbi:MAG TPA: hypothetical protein VIH57_14545, partial [Bacteroidales bacterium]